MVALPGIYRDMKGQCWFTPLFHISCCGFAISLYFSLALFLFPNIVTLTGGGREARRVGRVRPQQSEAQVGQSRTEKHRAGDALKLTALATENNAAVHAVRSKEDRAQKGRQCQNNPCVDGTGNSSKSLRGGKVLKEPDPKTWSDLMMPEEDLGSLKESPAASSHSPAVGAPGSPHGSKKGNIGSRSQVWWSQDLMLMIQMWQLLLLDKTLVNTLEWM